MNNNKVINASDMDDVLNKKFKNKVLNASDFENENSGEEDLISDIDTRIENFKADLLEFIEDKASMILDEYDYSEYENILAELNENDSNDSLAVFETEVKQIERIWQKTVEQIMPKIRERVYN